MYKIAAYKIIPELNLVIEVFGGNLTIMDAIELKKKESQDKDYNPEFNFIVSINEIKFDKNFDIDFSEYIETLKEEKKVFGKRKSAIITNTPEQVVASTLYGFAIKEEPMNFRIVSTIGAA